MSQARREPIRPAMDSEQPRLDDKTYHLLEEVLRQTEQAVREQQVRETAGGEALQRLTAAAVRLRDAHATDDEWLTGLIESAIPPELRRLVESNDDWQRMVAETRRLLGTDELFRARLLSIREQLLELI